MDFNKYEIVRNPNEEMWTEIMINAVDELNWANSIYDYQTWLKSFAPNDFALYFAIEKETQKPVGTISLSFHRKNAQDFSPENTLAMIGLFFVCSNYRGNSIGIALFDKAMKEASLAANNKFLVGAEKMWKKYYEISGFNKLYEEWIMELYETNCSDICPELLSNNLSENMKIEFWDRIDFEDIFKFDQKIINEYDRKLFLKGALEQKESITKVVKNTKTGEVVGICRIRKIINNNVDVGPFYANSKEIANALFRSTLEEFFKHFNKSELKLLNYKFHTNNPAAMEILKTVINNKEFVHKSLYYFQYTEKTLKIETSLVFSSTESDTALI